MLKAVLDKSKAFDAADNNSLSLEQERDRGLIYLGVIFDPVTSQYYVHGDALDPARMYSVTASDYIALGDTGYSDLVTPAVGQSIRLSTYSSLSYKSAIVCRHESSSVAGLHGANCRDDPQTADDFDGTKQPPFDTTKGLTPTEHFLLWAKLQKRRPSLYQGQTPREAAVQQAPLWSFSLTKPSLGFTMNQHNGTENDLAARFAGVPVSQVNAPNTNTTLIDFSSRMQRDSRTNSAFAQLDRLQSSAHAPG